MKKMNLIILFLFCCSILNFCFCKKGSPKDSTINKLENVHIMVQSANGENIPDSIRKYLSRIVNDKIQVKDTIFNKLINYFKINEHIQSEDFPSKNSDDELFYKAISQLEINSNIESMEFILKLNNIIVRNVEFSEYLMYEIPKFAINNINDFLKLYSQSSEEKKEALLEYLEYFNSKEEYNSFMNELNSVKNENLKKIANMIKFKMNNRK